MLTQELVRYLFDYNPETGILTRKISVSHNARKGDIAGCLNGKGMLQVKISGIIYFIHRIVFLHYHGYLPEFIDHRDKAGSNNRITNLRECTLSQSGYNRKANENSEIKGVRFKKNDKIWVAQLCADGKKLHLGSFSDPMEAKKAVRTARKKHHGEFLNHG